MWILFRTHTFHNMKRKNFAKTNPIEFGKMKWIVCSMLVNVWNVHYFFGSFCQRFIELIKYFDRRSHISNAWINFDRMQSAADKGIYIWPYEAKMSPQTYFRIQFCRLRQIPQMPSPLSIAACSILYICWFKFKIGNVTVIAHRCYHPFQCSFCLALFSFLPLFFHSSHYFSYRHKNSVFFF